MNTAMAHMESSTSIPPVLQSAHLKGRIAGLVAHLTVEHCYRNASSQELEVTYTFPMPPAAVLTGVSLTLNGQCLQGMVREKDKANEDYDTAIEDGDSAVLVEQAGPGLYTATLGNLLPAEEAVISYEWVMPLQVRAGTARLTIPTAVKDRFGNPAKEAKLKSEQVPRQNALVEYPFTVEIDFDETASAARISCPDHDAASVAVIQSEAGATKRLSITEDAFLDRNLHIVLEDVPALNQCTLIDAGEEVFFHATAPSPAPKAAGPVAIKLLIDCSGSMQDENAIAQAKRAATTLLECLGPEDFASLSSFGNHTFHANEAMLPMSPKHLGALKKAVGALAANLGGTELEAAMIETLRKVSAPEGAPAPCILLITDGASWAHRRIVRAATRAGCKVFCIGVGSNPAASLLHEIAVHTDGDHTMLAQSEDMKPSVLAMLGRMRQSSGWKAQTNWADRPHRWAYPSEATPLYCDEQLHFFGRTRKEFLGEAWAQTTPEITLSNAGDSGQPLQLTWSAAVVRTDPAMAKLIAQREMMVSAAPEALDIALRHQLISEQTSMIVVHERDAANMALGVPVHTAVDHMSSMNYAQSMSLSYVMHSLPGSAEQAKRLSDVRFSPPDQAPALWRTGPVLREDVVPLDSDEPFGIPAFLRKQVEPDTPDEAYVASLPLASPARALKRFNDILEKIVNLEDALAEWLKTTKLPLAIQLLWTNGTPGEVNAIIAATLLHINALVGNDHVRLNARAVAMLSQLVEEEHGRLDVHTHADFKPIHEALEGVMAEDWPQRKEREHL